MTKLLALASYSTESTELKHSEQFEQMHKYPAINKSYVEAEAGR